MIYMQELKMDNSNISDNGIMNMTQMQKLNLISNQRITKNGIRNNASDANFIFI